ncbi:hypothetical protein [Snodgrassella alvi]|uniref:hypothetical protein n=1 Tax=Snodgrassella alvi TaxID=1196083 RepID=UPI00117A5BA7|nr:hypothetical protein [Snodgrassella alvi]
MQYYCPSKKRLLIVTGISLLVGGCSLSDWYNGYYVDRSSWNSYQKDSDAYYGAESAQMKELRRNNDAYCTDLARKPENREARAGYPNGIFNTPMYDRCMENRGTPTFETYQSNRAKKRDAERRALGEIVLN